MGELPQFRDRSAHEEPIGFDMDQIMPGGLPGMGWSSGNMFRHPGLFMPNCDMDAGIFTDTVWEQPGDPSRLNIYEGHPVLGNLFYSDAIRRLQAVEQLTLPPAYTTIPNTGAFSRFEHIWGSVLFVRQMAAKHGIQGAEATRLQLRTLVSDVAHTFGSHLGDWMFQGVGGAENQHDLELKDYLRGVGVSSILAKYGFGVDEVVFPDVQDWVEADQPDLCVDRVDYGLREMNRWNQVIRSRSFGADDFTLTPDGMLAMTNQQRARLFSEGFLLLSQEHWSEPTHRFMLDMLMLRTKLFYGQGLAPRNWVFEPSERLGLLDLQKVHPRDLMYVTDPAQERAYALPNLGGHTLQAIMESVARYRRQYVWPGREARIDNYMRQFAYDITYDEILRSGSYLSLDAPELGSYQDEYPQVLPLGFAILDADVAAETQHEAALDFPQPPFKTRQIDPLVQTKRGFQRLSELDPSYADRLDEHARGLRAARVARLAIADPQALDLVRSITDNVEAGWQRRLENSRRLTPVELRELVTVSSREVIGTYPFMTFHSF